MKLEVKVEGSLIPHIRTVRARLASAVAKTARDIEEDARQSILSGPKTGRIYRRGGVVHQASAPGEAPAADTGALADSIQAEQVGDLTWEVAVGEEYGIYLEREEYGTVEDRAAKARPFMGPAAERAWPGFQQACEAALKG